MTGNETITVLLIMALVAGGAYLISRRKPTEIGTSTDDRHVEDHEDPIS